MPIPKEQKMLMWVTLSQQVPQPPAISWYEPDHGATAVAPDIFLFLCLSSIVPEMQRQILIMPGERAGYYPYLINSFDSTKVLWLILKRDLNTYFLDT